MPKNKLFLLDAMALVYRAYYALVRSPRITSGGKNTNAQFGFTNTLNDLLKREDPSHIAVVWDTAAPTSRHTDYAEYKANRSAAPEDFKTAIPDIKRIIDGFNIPSLAIDGYEADDIIGTLAWQARDKGYEVYMVTPDKDYGQLVGDDVYIYKPGYKGGTFEILGQEEVCAKWDIDNVQQVIDILGMMGDAVDNIPGIAGVGEKTAVKLLKQYGNMEAVLADADNIKGSIGEKIRNGREQAIMSKQLATIITDVPVTFDERQFLNEPWDIAALTAIFTELEFKTMGQRILGIEMPIAPRAEAQLNLFGGEVTTKDEPPTEETAVPTPFKNISNTPHDYQLISNPAALAPILLEAMEQAEISIDTETTSIDAMNALLLGISLSWEAGKGYYIDLSPQSNEREGLLAALQPLLDRKDVLWIGQNLKYDIVVLGQNGIQLHAPIWDTMVASYSLAPHDKHGMDMMARRYLGYEPVSIETLIGKKGKNQGNMADLPPEQVAPYAAEDADVTWQLKQKLAASIEEEGVTELFEKVENPLVTVLAKMEQEGVRIDTDFLKKYAAELGEEIAAAEERVYAAAGVRFNLGSPKQLGEVLFDKLKLDDKAKKTKTGQYATGEAILSRLRGKSPIIDDILIYRELSKLKSTYADALPLLQHPKTGRIHSSFMQTVVVTGRLSSNNPNLQNIPIRTERGREIRRAFVPRDHDYVLLSADYSQVELRVMAAMSGDPAMIAAFSQHKDIHRATASKVYGVAEEEVTQDMRRNAKAVNFGLIYGQSAFGLAENLDISRGEAKEIIDNYFREFAAVKNYMDAVKRKAAQDGYVSTIMGRRIHLADINSSNQTLRGFAERLSINAPIQGSAADMIKLAMIKIDKELGRRHLQSKLILQVHDELIFDVLKTEQEEVSQLVKEYMEAALTLDNGVPLVAEWGVGDSWLEAH